MSEVLYYSEHCIGVSPLYQKHHLLFLAKPPLNLQASQAPHRQSSPLYWFLMTPPPPLKLDISVNPQNIKVCHPQPHLIF